ncbi:hypothetical protein NMG60_11026296 [Bertholletia excelsa]
MGGGGREGDWECSSCRNRNYAFRTLCNRCKQPRILVDAKTPADSKWLPRIGDWICGGCTNNNYASREKCKKCGQPKEIAAMPAIAVPGVSLSKYTNCFSGGQGIPEQYMNSRSGVVQQSLPLSSNGSLGGAGESRGQPTVLGAKRVASDDLVHCGDYKRLNRGQGFGLQYAYPALNRTAVTHGNQTSSRHPPLHNLSESSGTTPNLQVPWQFPRVAVMPVLVGKGAKQWRDGDWMCTNCNNHNYASRSCCNRCKNPKDAATERVNAM